MTAERWSGPGHGGLEFDVDGFRALERRAAVIHRISQSAIVLGSTQSPAIVDAERASAAGCSIVRRRSGGGAVLVHPNDPLWIDLWVPRGDHLWDDDVHRAAEWVGDWWRSVLQSIGGRDLQVHRGPAVCTRWSGLVCFAGVGPGELTSGQRKLVGVAQWRSRQGALFHVAAYRRWTVAPLVDLLDLPAERRINMSDQLSSAAVGLDDFIDPAMELDELIGLLVDQLPEARQWLVSRGG